MDLIGAISQTHWMHQTNSLQMQSQYTTFEWPGQQTKMRESRTDEI